MPLIPDPTVSRLILLYLNSDDGGHEPQTAEQIFTAVRHLGHDYREVKMSLDSLLEGGWTQDVQDDPRDVALYVARATIR